MPLCVDIGGRRTVNRYEEGEQPEGYVLAERKASKPANKAKAPANKARKAKGKENA